jgi:S-adenosylmethionine hydrolase
MRTIALLTDFGHDDWFIGAMKGVIFSIATRANVLDITHGVPPGNIRAAAFALAVSYRFFPRGTIHTVVVDPGVGSERVAVAVRTRDYFFVGPDNGVLSWALRSENVREIRRLENVRYFLDAVSKTFHGRDIFAPVAAHLSRGLALKRLGPEMQDIVCIPWPEPRVNRSTIRGEILYLDRFGNAISNVPNTLAQHGKGIGQVQLSRRRSCPLRHCYQAVPIGKAVAVPGSTGFIEIAINQGNASRSLGLKPGSPIFIPIESD